MGNAMQRQQSHLGSILVYRLNSTCRPIHSEILYDIPTSQKQVYVWVYHRICLERPPVGRNTKCGLSRQVVFSDRFNYWYIEMQGLLPGIASLSKRWSLMAVVSQDRFHFNIHTRTTDFRPNEAFTVYTNVFLGIIGYDVSEH